MESEKQQLLELIYEYKLAVSKAVDLLNNKSEKDKGFQLERIGYLDDLKEIQYEFHGIGCLVKTKKFVVDFDFGEKGRCDSIDPWFLFYFLKKNNEIKEKYPLIISGQQVENLLQEFEKDDLIAKNVDPLNERKYYLTSDIHNPNPPIWKPNWPGDNASPTDTSL